MLSSLSVVSELYAQKHFFLYVPVGITAKLPARPITDFTQNSKNSMT